MIFQSEGYNEILFEDAQNSEQLNIRAQKDYSLLVLNDATEHIQHDRSERVDNNEDVTIHGYRKERVNKSKTETIDIAKALTIGAGYQVSVGASKNETVGISSTEEVGLLKHTIVGEKYEITVGETKITMYADGTILVEGDNIDITGTEHIEIIAPKIYLDDGSAEKALHSITYDLKDYFQEDFGGLPFSMYLLDKDTATQMSSGTLNAKQRTQKVETEGMRNMALMVKRYDSWELIETGDENDE